MSFINLLPKIPGSCVFQVALRFQGFYLLAISWSHFFGLWITDDMYLWLLDKMFWQHNELVSSWLPIAATITTDIMHEIIVWAWNWELFCSTLRTCIRMWNINLGKKQHYNTYQTQNVRLIFDTYCTWSTWSPVSNPLWASKYSWTLSRLPQINHIWSLADSML